MLAPSITTNTINTLSFFQVFCSQPWSPLSILFPYPASQCLSHNRTVPQIKMKIQNERKKVIEVM